MKIQHKAGADIIHELSENAYPTYNEAFRETVSNAFDENSNKIHINVSEGQIIFEDYGNGIEDVHKFSIYGESSKEGESVIGEKGLGKLALLKLAEENTPVIFYTNNGKTGISITMTKEYLDCYTGGVNEYLNHKGTKIIIPNPRFVPTVDELEKYLAKTFGLLISKGKSIYINNTKIRLDKYLDVNEIKICDDVTGNITEDKKGNGYIGVYIKNVFVTNIMVDPQYLYSGWINCNKFKPTTSRNDLVRDKGYKDTLIQLRDYVSQFPTKEEKDLTNKDILFTEELSRMCAKIMEEQKINLFGSLGKRAKKGNLIEVSIGGGNTILVDKKGDDDDDDSEFPDKIERSMKLNNKQIKHLTKSKSGLLIVNQSYGNEMPPIFFADTNIIVVNITNDLYKVAMKDKPSLGPKYLRIMPYIVRVMADIIVNFKEDISSKPPKDVLTDMYKLQDNISRRMLEENGEIEPSLEKSVEDPLEKSVEDPHHTHPQSSTPMCLR